MNTTYRSSVSRGKVSRIALLVSAAADTKALHCHGILQFTFFGANVLTKQASEIAMTVNRRETWAGTNVGGPSGEIEVDQWRWWGPDGVEAVLVDGWSRMWVRWPPKVDPLTA